MQASKKWFVIINPTSGNGASKKLWPKIKQELEDNNFEFKFAFTKHPNHSKKLLQKPVNKNIKHIICVGGDGTIHNIVNAILQLKKQSVDNIKLGVIPIGTGNDWVKTHGISSKNYKQAIQVILKGNLKQQDIGKITLNNNKNKEVYFNNLAGVGFDGYIVTKVSKYKHLGAVAYLIGTLMGLFSFKNYNATVTINSETKKVKALMILIGICKYSGGGMQLTKSPVYNDGLFDISIAENFKAFDIIKNIIKLFNGKVTNSKKINTYKTTDISVNTEIDQPIQADGELLGFGSFKCSIVKNALRFYSA
ncbi:diacylglycerol/lipid kinase family protein [Pontimicrobium sp. IMCC45349]|uniref:diacylglycerol/lipid kinase family protein n=1 Tax=Pontimicrobium sp. IMCC45349 TaxID=3391574 RepID=UPI0039A2220D